MSMVYYETKHATEPTGFPARPSRALLLERSQIGKRLKDDRKIVQKDYNSVALRSLYHTFHLSRYYSSPQGLHNG